MNPFLALSVECASTTSLESLVYSSLAEAADWVCESCEGDEINEGPAQLTDFPRVLVFRLKHASPDQLIRYPLDLLNLSRTPSYKLTAVVLEREGHAVAEVRSDEEWLEFDDEDVLEGLIAVSPSASLLFYECCL